MSFGSKQHHNRFYTSPNIRQRHIQDFVTPEISRQRYRSTSSFNNSLINPFQQNTMKQSYLRLVNKGINSRIYTKDQLGYEGLKFQKDIINRYSDNDYQKNSAILEKFKRQAQELKRNKKRRHLKTQPSAEKDRIPILRENQNNISNIQQRQKYSISLLPITNNHLQIPQNPDDLFASVKNTSYLNHTDRKISVMESSIIQREKSNSTMLPSLKLKKYLDLNNINRNSTVFQQEESHNQNQQYLADQISPSLSRVCDVGISAKLSLESDQDTYRWTKRHKKHNSKGKQTKKNSQSFKLQVLSSKNKQLKKKYENLKQKLSHKSQKISQRQQLQQEEQGIQDQQQFQEKISNLSQMIHSLCDKLRQGNVQLTNKIMNNNIDYQSKYQQMQQSSNKMSASQLKNSTQIKLFQNCQSKQQNSKQTFLQNRQKYASQIEKIDSFRKERPKVVYTLNRDSKNIKIDPLRLLKNHMKQQNQQTNHFGGYSLSINKRSKTEGY